MDDDDVSIQGGAGQARVTGGLSVEQASTSHEILAQLLELRGDVKLLQALLERPKKFKLKKLGKR